jgi:hypothetical protein
MVKLSSFVVFANMMAVAFAYEHETHHNNIEESNIYN